jgi:hypothetical protein
VGSKDCGVSLTATAPPPMDLTPPAGRAVVGEADAVVGGAVVAGGGVVPGTVRLPPT